MNFLSVNFFSSQINPVDKRLDQTTEELPSLPSSSIVEELSFLQLVGVNENHLTPLAKGMLQSLKVCFNILKNFAKYTIAYPLMGLGKGLLVLKEVMGLYAAGIISVSLLTAAKVVNAAISLPIGVIAGLIGSPLLIYHFYTTNGVHSEEMNSLEKDVRESVLYKFIQFIASSAAYPLEALSIPFTFMTDHHIEQIRKREDELSVFLGFSAPQEVEKISNKDRVEQVMKKGKQKLGSLHESDTQASDLFMLGGMILASNLVLIFSFPLWGSVKACHMVYNSCQSGAISKAASDIFKKLAEE